MPVSNVAVIPSEVPSHHQGYNNDSAKYQQKYKKLKQLVKETIFVSDEHFLNVIAYRTVTAVTCTCI